jgi:hypothetical protein
MPVRSVFRPTKSDADHAEQIREIIKESIDLLRQPEPDTFLGRKTQEPFRKEGDE